MPDVSECLVTGSRSLQEEVGGPEMSHLDKSSDLQPAQCSQVTCSQPSVVMKHTSMLPPLSPLTG